MIHNREALLKVSLLTQPIYGAQNASATSAHAEETFIKCSPVCFCIPVFMYCMISKVDEPAIYKAQDLPHGSTYSLDSHHSHFVLVEEDPNRPGATSEMRVKLLKHISLQRTGYGGTPWLILGSLLANSNRKRIGILFVSGIKWRSQERTCVIVIIFELFPRDNFLRSRDNGILFSQSKKIADAFEIFTYNATIEPAKDMLKLLCGSCRCRQFWNPRSLSIGPWGTQDPKGQF